MTKKINKYVLPLLLVALALMNFKLYYKTDFSDKLSFFKSVICIIAALCLVIQESIKSDKLIYLFAMIHSVMFLIYGYFTVRDGDLFIGMIFIIASIVNGILYNYMFFRKNLQN